MELRLELLPPKLDEEVVVRLVELAVKIDGAAPELVDKELKAFNQLAQTSIPFVDFQGIYGAEEHEDWVRRILLEQRVKPVPSITYEELIEIAERMLNTQGTEQESYMAIFDVNVPVPSASNLMFYPPSNYDGDISEYEPTAQQLVHWAMEYSA
ncbi:hypothetical protein [Calycomorphotria hydatis]|uniref:Uncharacterized protein n=1 Tax=Calycomorphotria hydatis TaxID=2528027 RepID=A0A517T4B2_9PLAN|nr:hypothetical protein [Calycomorphotria hydatis]QDT63205.1 hypothetical protein V22_04230 [Calycomorphotria hydatis]